MFNRFFDQLCYKQYLSVWLGVFQNKYSPINCLGNALYKKATIFIRKVFRNNVNTNQPVEVSY
jgi:hypothetical protein